MRIAIEPNRGVLGRLLLHLERTRSRLSSPGRYERASSGSEAFGRKFHSKLERQIA